jgi:O-antigen/teichoic acid export membrane protein
MSTYLKLAKHSTHYLIAEVGSVIAGLISMPILARILEREDYGRLSLIMISVNFLAAFARLGLPQSVARYLPEHREQGAASLGVYVSSIFQSSLIVSVGLVAILAVLGALLKQSIWNDWSNYIALIGVLLCNEVMYSIITELYRAQERSVLNSALILVVRFSALAVSLLFFFYVSRTLDALLIGKAVAQMAVLTIFVLPMIGWGYLKLHKIDPQVVKNAIGYGLPLSIATAADFLIAYGDRYVIQGLLDAVQVARYSLPYDILQQVETAITTPIRMAVIPMIFAMIVNQNLAATTEFVSQVIRGMIIIIVPIIFGVSILGYDLVTLIGSEKYADSSTVVPILAAGVLLGGISFLFTVGLSYQKRTDIIALITVLSGTFNILLNILLVPYMGIIGAAWATAITYIGHVIILYRLSSRYLKVQLYLGSFVRTVVAALIMAITLWWIAHYLPNGALGLLIKIPLGMVAYSLAVVSLDGEIRTFIRRAIANKIGAATQSK